MDLLNFLESIKYNIGSSKIESNIIYDKSIIIFLSKSYSSLLRYYLYNHLHNIYPSTKFLNIDKSPELYKSNLQVTFLGESLYYFINFSSNISKKDIKKWENFIIDYKGPHTLFIYNLNLSNLVNDNGRYNTIISVDIPESININSDYYNKLYNLLFNKNISRNKSAIVKGSLNGNLCFDDVMSIMTYHSLLGNNFNEFFNTYKANLISIDKSLFTLSEYLFAKNKNDFFRYWSEYCDNYPQEYWMVFFLEQLWQASLFLKRINKYNILYAKKNAYRLPFSFLNKDYKRYNYEFLQKKYHELYTLDYKKKNINTLEYGLDLFLSKFFI